MFQGAVEAVPNILTKDTGIVLELLEFPPKDTDVSRAEEPIQLTGEDGAGPNQNNQAWCVPRSLPPCEKEEKFWQFLT